MILIKTKNRFVIFFLLLSCIANAQNEKRVVIKGTKISMIPPDGFLVTEMFSGFQEIDLSASIMINELPVSYFEIASKFTKESLLSKGMILTGTETVNFNNTTATLYRVTQQANGEQYLKEMLMFGDSSKTIMINGIYPEKHKNIANKVKEAILTAVYDNGIDENPAKAATFEVDLSSSEFKPTKYFSGTVLYTIDGKIPSQKPTYLIGNSISFIQIEDKEKFATERLKKMPNCEKYIIESTKKITIDSLNGFEIIANGKNPKGNDEKIYQTILFTEDFQYFIIYGSTETDFEKYIGVFRTISNTFKRKKE